ncbi:MAG: hypothetical protein ACOY71_08400 [Gemmatimonadota bacterium]
MADKTPDQLSSLTELADDDVFVVYDISASLLKKMQWSILVSAVGADLGAAYLQVSNNLSDLASPSAARTSLGLGTAALLGSSALFQVSNNLSEVANAATARTNIGAAAENAPVITGGITYTGSVKGNVQAVASTSIDVSVADFFTKSISANTTFTFDNPTASKAQGFILILTISGSAIPTWPASVDWSGGTTPTLGDGKHVLGFLSADGGTTWLGFVGGVAFS